ncbi:MAG: acyl-CoA dehydrogenase C-terminal domain-containing protein [Ilumatobacteraceae bacterium]
MSDYAPPLDDIRFVLDEILDLAGLAKLPTFEHADSELVHGALAEAGRFAAEVTAPLNRVGDREHSRRNADGSVTTPEGFAAAYRRYVESGWGSVPFPQQYGGGGFPWLVATAIGEMMASANAAFSLAPTLTQGAIDLLLAHGSERQKDTYLNKMVTGEWTGTMNLTEPDAGSDLGAVRTKAVPDGDVWRITGQKAFITYGEHDLADNIVHLVLARVPDAPAGTRGISCFIVPKVLVGADGQLGEHNRVVCVSIEDKLGIHASPTCVLDFDDAEGYLIGEPNEGMRYMFTMMNNARLVVGVQGVAIAERAYQQAVAYAMERHQGRAPGAAAGVSSPIIEHPDVRRMLLTQKASIEAARSLAYLVAESMDLAANHTDQVVRDSHRELVELLTPVTKAWCTDLGVELSSIALQVQGGAGYIEETGAAQYYRDARISPIYEGTNGIQAIDLVMRKLSMRDGAAVTDFIGQIEALDIQLELAGPELSSIGTNLAAAIATLRSATEALSRAESVDRLAGAGPYLRMFGIVTGGWLMARQALAATRKLNTGQTDFLRAKLVTARFYCEQILPQAAGLFPAATAGAGDLLALTPDQF